MTIARRLTAAELAELEAYATACAEELCADLGISILTQRATLAEGAQLAGEIARAITTTQEPK